jgi:purine catabolism regulator
VTDLTDPINVRQAIAQAREASTSGTGWCMFGDLRTRSIDSLIDGSLSRAWAESYLRPFSAVDEGAELKTTLRAWLAHHGQVDATAQDLGIHRHTVRHRLRRAEAALGASLDDPSVRADLWFALRSLG